MLQTLRLICVVTLVLISISSGLAQTPAPTPSSPTAVPAPPVPRHAHWRRLFDGKDLKGWYTYLPSKGINQDPENIFQVLPHGIVQIEGKEFGYLATTSSYKNYRVRLEVKWGMKKWPPRDGADTPRDTGLLINISGPDRVWPKGIECQIQQGDFGTFYPLTDSQITVNGKTGQGTYLHYADKEKPYGQWNTVEVICQGDTITNIVNGYVVNVGTQSTATEGKILLQSEGAEVQYRNIELLPLDGFQETPAPKS